MITYEEALKNQQKASIKSDQASIKLREANKVLEDSKRNLNIECDTCSHLTKVSDIEVIDETFGGYPTYENYDPEWHYSHRICWVCPECKTPQRLPKNEGPFVLGFTKYVKVVHEWKSDSRSCSGRVLELLAPHFKAEEKRIEIERKEKRIREAKKLLEDEGILGNTEA
jgi:hypothetical protein